MSLEAVLLITVIVLLAVMLKTIRQISLKIAKTPDKDKEEKSARPIADNLEYLRNDIFELQSSIQEAIRTLKKE